MTVHIEEWYTNYDIKNAVEVDEYRREVIKRKHTYWAYYPKTISTLVIDITKRL